MNLNDPSIQMLILLVVVVLCYTLYKIIDTVSYAVTRSKEAKYENKEEKNVQSTD